jgi:hypothetical protein
MTEVFTDLVYEKVLTWIDDIAVLDKTLEAYLDKLRQAFKRFLDKSAELNPKKTDICSREKNLVWPKNIGRRSHISSSHD